MLRARVITALCLLGGLLIVVFLLPRPAAALAFAGVAALAAAEWSSLMKSRVPARAGFVIVVLLSCLAAFAIGEPLVVPLWWVSAGFWLILAPLWLIRGWSLGGPLGYLCGWLLVVPTWAAMLALRDRGPWWLLAGLAMVWVADISAYFAGRRFGKHKLAPAISPGKTWEGVAGAILGVMVYAAAAAWLAGLPVETDPRPIAAILLAVAVSVVGDLFESMAKRQAGVKDSGRLLPGHGGILDRIDSQTSALPLLALFAYAWI